MRAWIIRADGIAQRYHVKSVWSLREKGYEYDKKRGVWYKREKEEEKKRKVKLTIHCEYRGDHPIFIDAHIVFWWDGKIPLDYLITEYVERFYDYLVETFNEDLISSLDIRESYELDVDDPIGITFMHRYGVRARVRVERLDLDEI